MTSKNIVFGTERAINEKIGTSDYFIQDEGENVNLDWHLTPAQMALEKLADEFIKRAELGEEIPEASFGAEDYIDFLDAFFDDVSKNASVTVA